MAVMLVGRCEAEFVTCNDVTVSVFTNIENIKHYLIYLISNHVHANVHDNCHRKPIWSVPTVLLLTHTMDVL